MRKIGFLAALLGVCLVSNAIGTIEDLQVPTWRGDDGSTYAEWDFLTSSVPQYDSELIAVPDSYSNPYGDTELYVEPGTLQYWLETWDGRNGVWPLSGMIETYIDNRPLALDHKDIQVQLTWQPQAVGNAPALSVLDGALGSGGQAFPDMTISEPTVTDLGDGWFHSLWNVTIRPNPNYEVVRIDGGIMVDSLVIDTICIPEPATMVLLGLGGLLLRRKK